MLSHRDGLGSRPQAGTGLLFIRSISESAWSTWTVTQWRWLASDAGGLISSPTRRAPKPRLRAAVSTRIQLTLRSGRNQAGICLAGPAPAGPGWPSSLASTRPPRPSCDCQDPVHQSGPPQFRFTGHTLGLATVPSPPARRQNLCLGRARDSAAARLFRNSRWSWVTGLQARTTYRCSSRFKYARAVSRIL